MRHLLMKMTIALTSLITLSAFCMESDFIAEQKKFERVKVAFSEKGQLMSSTLKEARIDEAKLNILIVAYKEEKQLEVYAKYKADKQYKRMASYPICASSGILGPKRQQGDGQVPEGFYHINAFNPLSSYYLSLGINYPNAADRKKSKAHDLGGQIYIHGACVTIGCLPMTDDKIKEIYLYAIKAKHSGQKQIPVYIFPFRMTEENMAKHSTIHKSNQELLNFWKNIKVGYSKFESEQAELTVKVNEKGDYEW